MTARAFAPASARRALVVEAADQKAVCVLTGTAGVEGVVTFTQSGDGPTKDVGDLKGLTEGKHGFHIHEKADFSNGCLSAGPHYNPFKKDHGGHDDAERHVGDMGNIQSDAEFKSGDWVPINTCSFECVTQLTRRRINKAHDQCCNE